LNHVLFVLDYQGTYVSNKFRMKFGKNTSAVYKRHVVYSVQIIQQEKMDIEETILSQMTLPILLEERNSESCK